VPEAVTNSTLPEDIPSAHRLITQLREQLGKSEREVLWLRHRVDVLCRRLFGKSSEKVSPDQLALAYEQIVNEPGPISEPVEMASGESPEPEQPKKRTGRHRLPSHLRRERVVVDLSEEEKSCGGCGSAKEKIGEETSEKLDYIPATLFVRETVIPKYACPRCHDGVVTASAPPQAIEKGLAAERLLSHVVTSKYADHLPLYRLEGIFGRQKVEISRTTMCGWVAEVARALSPIYDNLRETIVKIDYIQTDDTPVTVLGDDGGSFKGRLWTYLDPLGKEVVFEATATRGRDGPEAFLSKFRGYLQADAYGGYDALYKTGRVVEVACWAHVRRKFFEAKESDPPAALMVALIQRLYQVEKESKDMAPEDRLALRRVKSVPILEELDRVRSELARNALPKSGLGEALRYLQNQREALGRFLEDGRLKLDNNGAENQLRVVAVGRKNWLFAGSQEGARRAAILYTLVQGCKLAGIDPFLYFRDVLIRVTTHSASRIDELTPKGWARAFAPAQAA
jgi:transposase